MNWTTPDPNRTAIIANRQPFSYGDLQAACQNVAAILLSGQPDLAESRVAFMVEPGFDYVRIQWGIWLAGGIAVPLCTTHPFPSLQYVLEDTEADTLVVSPQFASVLGEYALQKGLRFIVLGQEEPRPPRHELPTITPDRRAMILYTSGTTNLPKGVVTTHANIDAQTATLLGAWAYSERDHALCVLPLHHVHGIINVVSCTLRVGGTVEFLPQFSPGAVFDWFMNNHLPNRDKVFMAVPTIYFKLIAYFITLSEEQKQALSAAMRACRLMVSGSAALPVSVMEQWETISGHRLLERYGMTEIGMAISNPYVGERRAGHIGQPLPGVSVRLVDESENDVPTGQNASSELTPAEEFPGEILVKGASVFSEYWRRPEATEAAFTKDGWFRTGDVAVLDRGYYRILGRNSTDIIKSGGYKISALEIEEVLRTHPQVADCSVVGLPDDEWGELVAAALVLHNESIDLAELSAWVRTQLPAYKVPRRFLTLSELPRNAMGKVTKNELKPLFIE